MKVPKDEKSNSAAGLHAKLQELSIGSRQYQSADELKPWKYKHIVFKPEPHEIEVAFRKRSEMGRPATTAEISYLIMDSVHYVDEIISKLGEL